MDRPCRLEALIIKLKLVKYMEILTGSRNYLNAIHQRIPAYPMHRTPPAIHIHGHRYNTSIPQPRRPNRLKLTQYHPKDIRPPHSIIFSG